MRWSFLVLLASAALHAETSIDVVSWRGNGDDDARWAQPAFDDSGWTEFPNLRLLGESRAFKGPTMWYRARVTIPASWRGESLAIALPPSGLSEVYVNGILVGSIGQTPGPGRPAMAFAARHRAFVIPAGTVEPGEAVIAIRQWRADRPPDIAYTAVASGLFARHPPRLALASTAVAEERLHDLSAIVANLPMNAGRVFGFGCGILLLLLYRRQPERSYLWIGLSLTSFGLAHLVAIPGYLGVWTPWNSPFAILWSAVFYYLGTLIPLYLYLADESPSVLKNPIRIAALAAAAAYALGDWPLQDTLRWIALPAIVESVRTRRWTVLAVSVAIFLRSVATFGDANVRMVGPFLFNISSVAQTLLAGVMTVVLSGEFRREMRRRSESDAELAAGRRAQLLLMSPGQATAGAFVVDQVYLPARDVGGDFCQAIPQPDGGLLVVTGDVSGKGLEAALVAASMLGAIRTAGAAGPAELLRRLNENFLGGRKAGFVACTCALFRPDGRVRLANAGNPAPYLDGREITLEPGLPLGIVSGVAYTEVEVEFTGQLTFLSDGVIEASGASGELFGFDRTREISKRSAQEIAEAAKQWGQNDDITVVTVRSVA